MLIFNILDLSHNFALQRYKKQPLKRTVSNDLCIFDLIFTNKTNGDVDCNASVPT